MSNCIFCKIVNRQERAWVIHETDASIAFFDIFPVNPYHTLIIPKQHYADIFSVPAEVLQEMMLTLKYVVDLYRTKLDMTDMQIINNNGVVGQQSVFHIHFHIAPRYQGDGQNLKWKTSPQLREKYDNMLKKLDVDQLVGVPK